MLLFAGILFMGSLIGVAFLFALKEYELRRGVVVCAGVRQRADARALRLKELAIAARTDLSHSWPIAVRVFRWLVHEAALASAALARRLERQAYKLADLVSHKRRYERRETRSEFLKKVAEHRDDDTPLE